MALGTRLSFNLRSMKFYVLSHGSLPVNAHTYYVHLSLLCTVNYVFFFNNSLISKMVKQIDIPGYGSVDGQRTKTNFENRRCLCRHPGGFRRERKRTQEL